LQRGISELAAKAANDPEKQAQHNADEDRGRQRKGDGPTTAAPVEVAWQTAEGEMEAAETENHDTEQYQEEAKKNKGAAKIMHSGSLLSRGQQSGCFAKKL
jgi:hypothetical protein